MSRIPYNQIFREQNKRLIRATFKKAIVNAVYPSTNTVDVYFVGNSQSIVKGIPVANNVTIAAVFPGNKCRIDVFDETNPTDMVLAYTY